MVLQQDMRNDAASKLLSDTGGTTGRTAEDDHRISRAEWGSALGRVQAAGRSWAPFAAFKHASASDFGASIPRRRSSPGLAAPR